MPKAKADNKESENAKKEEVIKEPELVFVFAVIHFCLTV
jgi:hypothetical protein